MMTAATVWAMRVGPCVLLWCSECGPMGVTEGQLDHDAVKKHLEEHA